jgi:hypothetical protein
MDERYTPAPWAWGAVGSAGLCRPGLFQSRPNEAIPVCRGCSWRAPNFIIRASGHTGRTLPSWPRRCHERSRCPSRSTRCVLAYVDPKLRLANPPGRRRSGCPVRRIADLAFGGLHGSACPLLHGGTVPRLKSAVVAVRQPDDRQRGLVKRFDGVDRVVAVPPPRRPAIFISHPPLEEFTAHLWKRGTADPNS